MKTNILSLFFLTISIFFTSCDEGDPEPFRAEEKIVSAFIQSPEIDNINFGDQVVILATLEVNVLPIEPARIIYMSSKGDLTYNGQAVNSGDTIEIDTTQEIRFVYVPKENTNPAFIGQPHRFEIIMTGCENSPNIRPNCSAAALSFKTVNE